MTFRPARVAAVAFLGAAAVVGASRLAASPPPLPGEPSSARTTAASALPTTEQEATATWCGTPSQVDAKPNAVAGNPIRFIYAIPSDGQDRFSSFASILQTDWETIDAWWRGQDPIRRPRADLARFSCGVQLDLSSIRMRQSSSQIAARETPFEQVFDSLDSLGFGSQRTKYVVYYDGPVGNENVCGVGGTLGGGLGLAVVSVRACVGAQTSQVAAHEIVHSFGAVAGGAPNQCPEPDDGHTCDNNRDLMYPVTDGTPLTGLTLDPGRDDYYAHSGSWLDVQDSQWLVQLDRQSSLALTISGTGQVEADVPGLLCSRTCSTTWNTGTRLALTPAPASNAKFVRWSGACAGSAQCLVTVGEAGSVSALFAPLSYRLVVRVTGKGSVRGARGGILCPGRCASPATSHRPLVLRASPARGWRLRGWTGACRGKSTVCTLPMTGNTTAQAVFTRR
jgi:hypothetical protein